MSRQPFNPNLIQPPPDKPRPDGSAGPLTVSQVTALVKQAIESALPSTLHVVGEISNFKRHSSGHLYLTLKDRASELSCVMWRSAAAKLKFAPQDGLEIVATGRVELFERAGRYQLYIRKLEPRGVGALELAFRQLRQKLSQEGLFDDDRKKPLPNFPRRIAVVTSPTGAAVADMLRTIERRFPCVQVLVSPVRVQGPGAAEEIGDAIRRLNDNSTALGGIDVLIVGRGGGSLEDLWAFNEEIVARAIHASHIPIISAVGHEVDVTIADLVADCRAATPTAAAELAVPVLEEVLADVDALEARLSHSISAKVELAAALLNASGQRRSFSDPLDVVQRREQVVDELSRRMSDRLLDQVYGHRRRLDQLEPIVQRIAPHAILRCRAIELGEIEHRLGWALMHRISENERAVIRCRRRLDFASPINRIFRHGDRLERLSDVMVTSIRHLISLHGEAVRRQEERLVAMGHQSVLGRGFSITRTERGRKIVRSISQLKDRQTLITEVADGEFESQVVDLHQLELFRKP